MRTIDTGTDEVLGEVDDHGVAVITLNRPERRNAFYPAMIDAVGVAIADAAEASDVGCVVITGAGGAFCAGGDVKAMNAANQRDGGGGSARRSSYEDRLRSQQRQQRATAGALWSMPKPTIAAVPGAVAGAGIALALACDLRYFAADAVFTTAFAKVGLAGDYGALWFLTRVVGTTKARELFYFSERITAADALALGIANAVFPEADLMDEVMRRARQLAAGPRVALGYMKENLNRAVHGEVAECLDLEAAHHVRSSTTDDHREAAQAFVEKRAPIFQGR